MKFKIRITGKMSAAEHFSEFKKDAKKLWTLAESGQLSKSPHQYEVGVPDLSWLGRILSPEKLKLLMAVRDRKPQSLYELAQILDRASSNVFRDAQELAGYGILTLTKTRREGRAQDIMRPEFPWDGFEIEMEKKNEDEAA